MNPVSLRSIAAARPVLQTSRFAARRGVPNRTAGFSSAAPHAEEQIIEPRSQTTRKRSLNDGKELKDFIQASLGPLPTTESRESEMSVPHTGFADMDLGLQGANMQSPGLHVCIETYGCQMNSADSELIRSILLGAGYQISEAAEESDVILLNTCAIRDNAERKIRQRLQHYRGMKRKQKRQLSVGVLGCMAERLKTKLLESEKVVDLVAGPDAYRDLPRLLNVVRGGERVANVQLSADETYADISPVRENPDNPGAFISIMRGCNNMCSYCIVPFTRGRERSRDLYSIVEEVRKLSAEGVKEVTLLGQNVNSYHDSKSEGADVHGRPYEAAPGFSNMFRSRNRLGYRFLDLLEAVSDVDPEMRIRFTSPHPKDFPHELLQLISERPNICNSIHMPAQSGSTAVLHRMRRGYTREAYLELVTAMREIIPGVAISSDFISGFCGETEEDHQDTLSLMRMVRYDQAYMYAYSLRERTHAAYKLEDDVPQEVKLRRLQEVTQTFRESIALKNKAEDEQRFHVVLLEGPSRRSTPEVPEIQGRSDTNKRVVMSADPVVAPSILDLLGSSEPAAQSAQGFVELASAYPSAGVKLSKGDYALVYVTEAGPSTLKAIPIARTTLAEAHSVPILAKLLGPRTEKA